MISTSKRQFRRSHAWILVSSWIFLLVVVSLAGACAPVPAITVDVCLMQKAQGRHYSCEAEAPNKPSEHLEDRNDAPKPKTPVPGSIEPST
jgi:hypothetical protein